MGVRRTKDGNQEPEIYDRINRGRVVITELNSILWHLEMTHKTKTHIYHAIIKSAIHMRQKHGCIKAKTVGKLNSTEIDFWRR